MLTVVETDRAQGSFVEISEEFPCTVSQRKHWALEQARPGDPALNIAARWRLEGQVAPTLLGRSLQMLIDRHEPLRTAFVERDHGPVQRVMRTAPTRLRIVDLSHLPEADREAAAADLAREEARRPFDVNHPPLLRATFVRLDETSADLLVTNALPGGRLLVKRYSRAGDGRTIRRAARRPHPRPARVGPEVRRLRQLAGGVAEGGRRG